MANVLAEARDGVLHVLVSRPEKRNALSRAVLAELRNTFDEAAADTWTHEDHWAAAGTVLTRRR